MLEKARQAKASHSHTRASENEAGVSTPASRACRAVTFRVPSP